MNKTMKSTFVRSSLMLLGPVLLAGASLPAMAQTASQVARPSYAPAIIQQAGGGLALPASSGLQAPDGADQLFVTPSGLNVSGGLPVMAEETAVIEGSIKGKRVSGAALFAAASQLEAAYARAGYLLVRVSLPPQTIQDGHPLKLVVTRGYVESVDISAIPERVRARVEKMLAPLVGRNDITRRDIERQLLLAGDIPGLHLRSTLKAGTQPGSTIITVDGRHDAVSATVSIDNGLSDRMGTWSAGLGVNFNSLLGLGEVVYAQLAGYPGLDDDSIFESDPRNRQMVAGVTVPIGLGSNWLGLEYVDSRTHPTAVTAYTLPDHFQRLSAKFGHHWVRSRSANLSTVISLDASDEVQQLDLLGSRTDFTEDKTRVVRLSQQGDVYLGNGDHLSGSATLSVGLDALGAREGTVALPLSRDGADPDFAKLSVEARFQHAFGQDFGHVSLAAKAQTSFGEPLVASEQLGIGGQSWLSAYDSGAITGDSAIAARIEWAFPQNMSRRFGWQNSLGMAIEPYLFAAGGVVSLEQANVGEYSQTNAMSVGLGARIGLSQVGTSRSTALTVEAAHGDADHIGDENRFNFALQANF